MLRAKRCLTRQVIVNSIMIAATTGLPAHDVRLAVAKTCAPVHLERHPTRGSHRSATAVSWVVPQQKYELLIENESLSDNSKSSLRFAVTVWNNSQDTIYVGETGRIRDFAFEVREINGKAIVPNLPGPQQLIVEEGKQSLVPVATGQEFTFHIDLVEAYRLPSGKYELSAKKTILLSDMRTTVEVRSDIVRFLYESPNR